MPGVRPGEVSVKRKWIIPVLTGAFVSVLGYALASTRSFHVPGVLLLWPGVALDLLLTDRTEGFGDWRDVFVVVMGAWPSWTLLVFAAYRTRWGFPLAGLLAVLAIVAAGFGKLTVGASLGVIGIGCAVGAFAYRSAGGKT
jgi:uncharacterized membrane protein (GlpM family)